MTRRALVFVFTAGRRPTLHTGFPCSDFSYSSRCARGEGGCAADGTARKTGVGESLQPYKQKRPTHWRRAFVSVLLPAATYSPTQFPMQYHRRYQA